MEIENGNSPPISQKPYTLALKHTEWVKRELNIIEEAGVIERTCFTMGLAPIVIVPKRTAPEEPPKRRLCVDY